MKTTKRPYFLVTSRRFNSGLFFCDFIFTSNFHDNVKQIENYLFTLRFLLCTFMCVSRSPPALFFLCPL